MGYDADRVLFSCIACIARTKVRIPPSPNHPTSTTRRLSLPDQCCHHPFSTCLCSNPFHLCDDLPLQPRAAMCSACLRVQLRRKAGLNPLRRLEEVEEEAPLTRHRFKPPSLLCYLRSFSYLPLRPSPLRPTSPSSSMPAIPRPSMTLAMHAYRSHVAANRPKVHRWKGPEEAE